ncbi:MAG: Rne/Rng family ribonuclease [Proteobacteria bacterium]|nr:Rne/Rng family ribonuclease [Pseudomonadota bacterium]
MARDTLVINVGIGETRVALVQDGVLAELFIERLQDQSVVGNVYLGKVTRVLPGMQAAFIDIGLDRAAFLHVEDVIPQQDMDSVLTANSENAENSGERGGSSSGKARPVTRDTPIRDVLKEGQSLVVQVSKGPIGTKGARVTSHVALPGRYAVYLPTVDHLGVSKRIGNERERRRLRAALDGCKPPHGGLIVRTVASGLTKKRLKADVGYMVKRWGEVKAKLDNNPAPPSLLLSDLDIMLRAVRDLFDNKVQRVIIDDPKEGERLRRFLEAFMPERAGDLEIHEGRDPVFDEYGIEDEISRALAHKVPLASGGYLIIDQAEALTAIDVNTGRFTGRGHDVEDTILQTNLEAVREIAYQLRFRNIGGLIVLDFIDMEHMPNRDRVYKSLLDALRRDRATTTTVRFSELGLVEMTRKRTRESLSRTLYEPCFYCDGTGQLKSKTSVCHEILRQLRREKDALPGYKITIQAHPAVCDMLQREERGSIEQASNRFSRQIVLNAKRDYHLEQFDLSGA